MKPSFTYQLEQFFELSNQTQSPSQNQSLKKMKTEYVSEENFYLLENVGYFPADWTLFFDRLSPFFEAGFLFRHNRLTQSFFYGKTIPKIQRLLDLKLPQSGFLKILKTDAKSMSLKLNMADILPVEKMSCFFVRLDDEFGIVLLTSTAEPWLQLKMNTLQKALINQSL